jgi:hypothetical protein
LHPGQLKDAVGGAAGGGKDGVCDGQQGDDQLVAQHLEQIKDVVEVEYRQEGVQMLSVMDAAGCSRLYLAAFGVAPLAEGSKADCDGQVADHILVKKHLDALCTR